MRSKTNQIPLKNRNQSFGTRPVLRRSLLAVTWLRKKERHARHSSIIDLPLIIKLSETKCRNTWVTNRARPISHLLPLQANFNQLKSRNWPTKIVNRSCLNSESSRTTPVCSRSQANRQQTWTIKHRNVKRRCFMSQMRPRFRRFSACWTKMAL